MCTVYQVPLMLFSIILTKNMKRRLTVGHSSGSTSRGWKLSSFIQPTLAIHQIILVCCCASYFIVNNMYKHQVPGIQALRREPLHILHDRYTVINCVHCNTSPISLISCLPSLKYKISLISSYTRIKQHNYKHLKKTHHTFSMELLHSS